MPLGSRSTLFSRTTSGGTGYATPPKANLTPFAIVLLTLLLLLALQTSLVSAASAASHAEPVPTVRVVSGVLPQSRRVSPLPRVGHWPHGDTATQDAAFFTAEDDAYVAWVELRRTMLQQPNGAAEEGPDATARAATDATGTGANAASGSPREDAAAAAAAANGDGGGHPAAAADVATFFTNGAARARQAALSAAMGPNTTLDTAAQLALAVSQAFALRDAVAAASVGRRPSVSPLAAEVYTPLTEHCFAHVTEPIDLTGTRQTLLGTGDSAVADGLIPFLPTPFIADMHIVTAVRRELERLRPLFADETVFGEMALGRHFGPQRAMAARYMLGTLAGLMSASERAVNAILHLSAPLYHDGIAAAAAAGHDIRQRIVANDESTEAQRAALKHLVRTRNRLQELEQQLRIGARHVRHGASLDAVTSAKDFSTETMAAVGLVLIAYQRLGCTAGLVALDALPAPSVFTALTGLRVADFALERRPLLHVLLFFSTSVLGVRELRLWMLESTLRLTPSRLSLRRSTAYGVYRKLYQICAVVALVMPVVWVLAEVLRLQLIGNVPLLALYAFLRPLQHIGLIIAVALAALIGVALSQVLYLLPSFIGDPARERRKKEA